MFDFMTRLHDEEKLLKEKIVALEKFIVGEIHKGLSELHQQLLAAQLQAMKFYHSVLSHRIAIHLNPTLDLTGLYAAPRQDPGTIQAPEALDVKVTGGGSSETPIPFKE